MINWQKIVLTEETPLIKAIEALNENCQFVAIVDSNYKLRGTLSDGDVRRFILRNGNIQVAAVSEAMNTQPLFFNENVPHSKVYNETKRIDPVIKYVPIVREDNVLINICSLSNADTPNLYSNTPVLIMAGGLGSRLGEITKDTPKSLLKINGVPVLEIILNNFKKFGFNKYFISVNHMSEMIINHFQDGSAHQVTINYLQEKKRLGTAGCLSLLQEDIENIIVINGDVVSNVDLQDLLSTHIENNAVATMCIKEHSIQIPYGVVKQSDNMLLSLEEKPSHNFFMNAGVYVLNKKALEIIPNDEYFDMTSLFELAIKKGFKTRVYTIKDYWIDIGLKEDYFKVQEDSKKNLF